MAALDLVTEVLPSHGCLQVLSSDKRSSFMSGIFQEMCRSLDIARNVFHATYSAYAVGEVSLETRADNVSLQVW
jgi:hypothetical protein